MTLFHLDHLELGGTIEKSGFGHPSHFFAVICTLALAYHVIALSAITVADEIFSSLVLLAPCVCILRCFRVLLTGFRPVLFGFSSRYLDEVPVVSFLT